ncbi:MAG: LysM peptidoglycan-binding domain-containing protein [Clostridia bacterium]|nr:LysM peptidoglycan-binding domain-containing protein [Clostridia bacterium]
MELNLSNSQAISNEHMTFTQDTSFTHETSEEFSLPDYIDEVRRVLCIRTGALPESKFLSDTGDNTSLEIGGTVTYLVIYTNEDGELCSLPLTSSYEAHTVLISHPSTVMIDTVIDNVSCRVNAPRRLTLKTRLKSRVLCLSTENVTEKLNGIGEDDQLFLERKKATKKALGLKQISLQGIRMKGELSDGGEENLKPVWCDASIAISDTRAQNNSVSVRGEVLIKCLCKNGERAVMLTKSMSLAEEIEAEGASLGDLSRVNGRCISLSISNEQSQNSTSLFFELECELEGELLRNADLSLTQDIYSTRHMLETEYRELETYTALKAQNTSFTISETVKRKSKDMDEIIDTIATPVYERAECKNGKCIISGKLSLTVIGKSTGEDGEEYLSEAYELPFKFATDMGKSLSEVIARCDVSASDVSAHLEGEKLLCSCEINLAYELFERDTVTVLDSASLCRDKEIARESACVRVYFPKEGDTLWEIAKKYHITVSQLKERNDLSDSGIDSSRCIII